MKLGTIELPTDAYVVVGENDGVGADGRQGRPFVFETYLENCSLDDAKKRKQYVAGRFGQTCLAKLTFLGETHE
jgi:hypothetical protein